MQTIGTAAACYLVSLLKLVGTAEAGKTGILPSFQKASDLYWKTAMVSVKELRVTNVKRKNKFA